MRWINAIVFQAVWFAAVIGAAHGEGWSGPAAILAFAALMLAFGGRAQADLATMGVAVAVGAVVDSIFAASGTIRYASPWPDARFAPVWILALWANFALTLHHALAYLKQRRFVAIVLGAVGAPLSYLAAARGWHAVEIAMPLARSLVVIAAVWAIATLLLVEAARRIDRRDASRAVGLSLGASRS